MSHLRDRFVNYMILRGFSPRTHESYLRAMTALDRHYKRPVDRLTNDEIQAFLVHIITERHLAWNSVNVYFSAIRCFYEKVLQRGRAAFHIPPRGRSHHRPFVLSRQAVEGMLRATPRLKHRALLSMVYGSGLRVSEVCRLQPHPAVPIHEFFELMKRPEGAPGSLPEHVLERYEGKESSERFFCCI